MSAPASKKARKAGGGAAASSAADERRSGQTRDNTATKQEPDTSRLRTKVRVRSVVDPETRRQVALARLAALELDNYEEAEALTAAAAIAGGGDAAYEDEGDEEVEQGGSNKSRKRKSRGAGSRGDGAASAGSAAAAGGAAASASKGDRAAKAVVHRHRNLDYVIAEEEYDSDGPNYKTIAAGPSSKPARSFCSVCGFFGSYTCSRCGLRFCSLRCQHTHKETRCLKFAE